MRLLEKIYQMNIPLLTRAARGRPAFRVLARAFWSKETFQLGEGFIGTTAKLGKALVSNDLHNDLRHLRKAVLEAGFRSIASIPLVARGSVVGVMNVASRSDRPFDSREINLLTAIGAWAGITIENARLEWNAARLKFAVLSGINEEESKPGTKSSVGSFLATADFLQLCKIGFAFTGPLTILGLIFFLTWLLRH
jgi:GAF domain-containing protein